MPTLQKLLAEVKEHLNFDGCRETLRKILHNMGYEFKKNEEERTVLMEKYEIAAWRARYIRRILKLRSEPLDARKTIVYVDETYVHVNYKPKKSWQGPSTSKMLENVSKGKRFIIVHAGTEKGFIKNALLIFSTKSKQADYHDDMNSANFSKWVSEKLLPNLDSPSVIIFDNASYHSIQTNKCPNTNTKKQDIRDWLTANNITWTEELKKAELYCLAQKHKPDPIYYIDELFKSHGHEVLRLPPYHCHLNPIEMVWSQAKRRVAEKNVHGTVADMTKKIEEAFAFVTAEHWKKYVDHVKRLEIEHEQKDNIIDDLDSFVINVQDSDSDESGSSVHYEGIEYLESLSSSNED